MASETQVYNLASKRVGGPRITSPDDDRTVARAIRAVWDVERRAAIRDGSWNFAMKRFRLPALSERPAFGFSRAYELPAKCVRLVEVYGCSRADYQLEGGNILADVTGPLDIRCLVDVETPSLWDDAFAEAFALRIALTIGEDIAGSAFDRSGVQTDYQVGIAASKRVDAMENPPIQQEEDDWILARMAGGVVNPTRPWG